MTDQVEEVKQKVDIISIIGERIELKKAGRNFKALCPFHGEKTPSFMVSPELQIYKCFGCGAAGDAISFLEQYEGMDFNEALNYLAERVGVKLQPRNFEVGGEKKKLYDINALAAKFYQYVLLNHPSAKVALNYLTEVRNIKPETIRTFQLGYSPDIQSVFRGFFIDKKRYKYEDLEKSGLTYQRDGRVADRFAGRIIFPLFDQRGNVAGFAGRVLPAKEKLDVGKYINTPETPIYHKSNLLYGLNLTRKEIKVKNEAVVVEGELDVISPWQAGIKNVVAIKGSMLTYEQGRLLSRFTQNVVLALDTDAAGKTAALRGIEMAESSGLKVKVALLGKYKDPDEAAIKDPRGLETAIKEAVPIWDFIVDLVFSKYKSLTGETKGDVSRELVPILAKIKDEIVQAHYIAEVARRLDVPYEAVTKEVEKIETSKDTLSNVAVIAKAITKGRREILEEKLISLVVLTDPAKFIKGDFETYVKTPLMRRIVEEYKDFSGKKKKI